MLRIDEVTKTWFEVLLGQELDEICQENDFPILDDISFKADWPYFEAPGDYEFEVAIFGEDSKASLDILVDIRIEEDMSFELFWDEDYIVSKLYLLNWKTDLC